MIPKTIHYCWFGGNELNDLAKKCISSWKECCPDYEIIEWNESNFDINCNSYVKEAYEAKKWAFVTDYVRLYVLKKYGGIYMDTDVEVLKNIDSLLQHKAFSGFENNSQISTGIMGAEKDNEWITYLLSYYNNHHFLLPDGSYDLQTNVITITEMTKSKYNIKLDNSLQEVDNTFTIYPNDYFCPKNYETSEINLTENTICIHHFNASWHNEKQKAFHDLRIKAFNKYGNSEKADNYYKNRARVLEIKYLVLNKEFKRIPELLSIFLKTRVGCVFKR